MHQDISVYILSSDIMSKEEDLLKEWCKEKGIDISYIEYAGYQDINPKWLGVTYPYSSTHCKIILSNEIKNTTYLWCGVLWHEFCHCWNHIKNEGSMHDEHFNRKVWSKPILHI